MHCHPWSRRPRGLCRLAPALGLLLLLVLGCDEDSKRTLNPPGEPDYLANDSPDNLIDNVVTALTAMDAEGYAALLYDGVLLAADSLTYAPYKFYFGQDPWGFPLPDTLSLAEEIACMARLLSGEPGVDPYQEPFPGVRDVDLEFNPASPWTAVTGGEAESDSCPDGAVRRSFDTQFLILLKSTYGSDTTGFGIDGGLVAHCIPVLVGDDTEWRLWKWRDIIDYARAVPDPPEPRTENANWGRIKWLFLDP